jgi:alkanesulfonate monooxygenase SsuD/methylene tetrahydromethanopterin reductase-like flavin-dependent oxidoreductase (luciferase family)
METREDIIVRTAQLADDLGYEAFSLPEAWSLDSTVLLGQIGLMTRRITLVAGVLSVWGRSPATLAMTATTLYRGCGGRFVLGLGASSAALVEGFHGIPFEHPAARLRDTTREVRRLISGERARPHPALTARPLALGNPAPGLPIWIGALGDRTIQLAAEYADGWFPAFQSSAHVAARATRFARPLTVAAGPLTVAATDAEAARAAVASSLAWYLCAMGAEYAASATRQGHGTAVRAVQAANPRPRPRTGTVPPQAQILIDEFTAAGTAAEVRDALAVWDEAADIVMLGLPPGLSWDHIESTLRAAAPDSSDHRRGVLVGASARSGHAARRRPRGPVHTDR